jgi:murein L,D-transpeptidase YcbB/YkuD
MKVKQIIKVAEAIDDSRKMPCDMHELEDTKYFSHSKQDFIAIADMDIVHLVRAFKNDRHRLANQLTDKDLIRQNEDLVSANRQLARQHDIWKEKAMNMVEKSSYDALKEQLDQEVRIDTQEGKVVELEDTLKNTIKSNNELIQLNKQLKESLRQVNLTPTVSTQAYDIAWKNIEELKDQVKSLVGS